MKLTISLVLLCASLCASLCAQPCPNAGPVLWGNAIPQVVTEANCGQTIVLAYYAATVVLPPQAFPAIYDNQVLQPIPFDSGFHVSVYNASSQPSLVQLVGWFGGTWLSPPPGYTSINSAGNAITLPPWSRTEFWPMGWAGWLAIMSVTPMGSGCVVSGDTVVCP